MKRKLWLLGISILIAGLFSLVVGVVDVQPIGPEGSKVGFATLNGLVFRAFSENAIWDKIGDGLIGVVGLIAVVMFGYGVKQWRERKELRKVDREILGLAPAGAVLVGVYGLFEKVLVVNYRPILEDGVLEPSFPSTHTLIAVTICVLAGGVLSKVWRKMGEEKLARLRMGLVVLMSVVAISRLLAGMHWLTDVVGAVLWSGVVVAVYNVFLAEKK